MNAKPKTELNRCVFVQKRNSVNGVVVSSVLMRNTANKWISF